MFRAANRLKNNLYSNYEYYMYRRNDKKIEYLCKFFLAPLFRNCQHFSPYITSKITYISSNHLESFRKMRNDIIDELLNYNGYKNEYRPRLIETMPLVATRLRKLMEENVIMWEYARAMSMIRLCEEFVKYESKGNRVITEEEYQKIYTMGWCFSLYETYSVLHDDIIDDADLRMGKATWHRQCNNHVVAIYDNIFLSNAARLLTTKYFAGQSYYYNVQKIITGIDVNYMWGTMMDAMMVMGMWPDREIADMYLWDLHKRRAYYISSFYISEPLKLAMHMVGKYDEKTAVQIDRVCYIFGLIFQSYDDYVEQQEKQCHDISQGTRTFFTVLAHKYADQHQRNILREHYGKNNADSVAAIKEVYRELDLNSKFQQQQKLMVRWMNDEIANIENEAVQNVLNLVTHSLHDWHTGN